MDNINFNNGVIGNKSMRMTKEFLVYGIGLTDEFALGDALGVSEDKVVEVDCSQVSDEGIGPRISMLLTGAPNSVLVIGNDHNLNWKKSKALQVILEVFKGRVFAEEELLLIKALKEHKAEFNTIEEVEDFLNDLGVYNVTMDEEDENTLHFNAPWGSKHQVTIRDGVIYLDGAAIKETVMVFVNSTKRHPVQQSLLGIKSPSEAFSIMMAALAVATENQQAHYAIGVIKGFSGILGPKDYEAAQFDAEGLEFKTKDTLGIALLHKSGDKIWAAAPSRTAGDLVTAAKELRAQDPNNLIITNNMGDGIFKIKMEDLISGNNSLRIKYDPATKMVTLNGSNIKGAAKSHAKHGGKVVVPVYITSKDPVSQCGQAVMPRAIMDDLLWAKRKIRFGGIKSFEFNQKNLVEFINMTKDAGVLVNEGDWVYQGTEIYDLNGVTTTADLVGASYARVTRVVLEQEAKGKELIFTLVVELEAYDTGEAKARGSIKAMINSMEAVGIVATFNGDPLKGLLFGDGVIKASQRFREMFTELSRGELSVATNYEPEGYAATKAMYKADPHFTFDDDNMEVITVDPEGVYGELEIMIESTSVQENVTDGAMTLHQLALPAGCPEGNSWLSATVMPGMRRKVKTLAYLSSISQRQSWKQPNAEVFILGQDELPLDMQQSDAELMEEFGKAYPNGIMVYASTADYVFLKAEYIKQVSAADQLGDSLVGFGEIAVRLLRLAAQPSVALLINTPGLITRFKIGAKRLAASKSLNKVFAVRNGASSKVVASRGTATKDLEVHPNGRTAKMLKKFFKTSKIEGKKVYMLRHPMVVGAVMTIKFNKNVSVHTMQVNEMFWRRVTAGDFDGDTINVFPIKNEKWAKAIDAHISSVVPNYDMNLALLGISSESEAMEMFGEKLDTSKTVDDLINKVKTMPLNTTTINGKKVLGFIETVEGGARAATWHTGTSYRILEGSAIRYALGIGGVRALFLGAFLYEHRGLAGKPVSEATAEALNLWVRCPRDMERLQEMWTSFGAMLAEVPGYANQKDTQLPKDLLVTSEMNRLMREGGIKENTKLLGEGWCDYNDIYPIQTLAWQLGRRRLSGAADLAAKVVDMDDIAEANNFKDTFLYQTLKLVSRYIGNIHSKMGGAISEEPEEEVIIAY